MATYNPLMILMVLSPHVLFNIGVSSSIGVITFVTRYQPKVPAPNARSERARPFQNCIFKHRMFHDLCETVFEADVLSNVEPEHIIDYLVRMNRSIATIVEESAQYNNGSHDKA